MKEREALAWPRISDQNFVEVGYLVLTRLGVAPNNRALAPDCWQRTEINVNT